MLSALLAVHLLLGVAWGAGIAALPLQLEARDGRSRAGSWVVSLNVVGFMVGAMVWLFLLGLTVVEIVRVCRRTGRFVARMRCGDLPAAGTLSTYDFTPGGLPVQQCLLVDAVSFAVLMLGIAGAAMAPTSDPLSAIHMMPVLAPYAVVYVLVSVGALLAGFAIYIGTEHPLWLGCVACMVSCAPPVPARPTVRLPPAWSRCLLVAASVGAAAACTVAAGWWSWALTGDAWHVPVLGRAAGVGGHLLRGAAIAEVVTVIAAALLWYRCPSLLHRLAKRTIGEASTPGAASPPAVVDPTPLAPTPKAPKACDVEAVSDCEVASTAPPPVDQRHSVCQRADARVLVAQSVLRVAQAMLAVGCCLADARSMTTLAAYVGGAALLWDVLLVALLVFRLLLLVMGRCAASIAVAARSAARDLRAACCLEWRADE